jgi:hypothetical protein
MNIYNIWADKKEDISAEEFVEKMSAYLQNLVETSHMEKFRIMRMKLGFRSMDIPEFHIMMEFKDLSQLDAAMEFTIKDKKTDELHVGFNQWVDVSTIQHALYRDWPDNV